MSSFNFVGEITINDKEDAKIPWYRKGETKVGDKYLSVNFSVAASKNNRAFVECFGSKQSKIKTLDTNFKPIEIDYEDRDDEDIIKNVANTRKHVVQLSDDDRHVFISDYDFVKFLYENIDDLKGKICQITGDVKKDFYEGKIRDRVQIRNIYVKDDDTKKNLKITAEFFWTKDGIDLADWKEEKKVTVNGYTQEYIDKDNGRMYVPQTIVFDCSQIKFDNEAHVEQTQFRLEQLGMSLDGEEVTINIKKTGVYENVLVISYQNGSEAVEFTEDQLTETQKKALKLGIKTLEDMKPVGQAYGDRVTIWKYVAPTLNGKHSDGMQLLDIKKHPPPVWLQRAIGSLANPLLPRSPSCHRLRALPGEARWQFK